MASNDVSHKASHVLRSRSVAYEPSGPMTLLYTKDFPAVADGEPEGVRDLERRRGLRCDIIERKPE